MEHESTHGMFLGHGSTPSMLWITNPPLPCHSSPKASSMITLSVSEKKKSRPKSSKKRWITKNLEDATPEKKKVEKPKENAFFFRGLPFSKFFQIQSFFDEIVKNRNRGKIIRKKSYATGKDAMSRMFWRTNPPLQCDIWYGSIS